MQHEKNTFKVILVGAGGCGKTNFVKRLQKLNFDPKYIPTLGVDVEPIRFETNHGNYCFNIWDCAGDPKFSGLRDGYYVQADACIIMMDLTSPETVDIMRSYAVDVKRMVGNIPVVLCGNKCDIGPRENIELLSKIKKNSEVIYFNVSAKNNFHVFEPCVELLRILTKKPNITLLENLPITQVSLL